MLDFQPKLIVIEGSRESWTEFKKGTGQSMGDSYKHQMERRRFSNPPASEEKPVCAEKDECAGCQFPSSGFICWGADGECMKTRFEKLKEDHNDQNSNEKVR